MNRSDNNQQGTISLLMELVMQQFENPNLVTVLLNTIFI